MTKRKTTKAATPLYRANTRRSEAGVGIVEAGEEVSLENLDILVIAQLVHAGFYSPVGEMPEDVALVLADIKAG